PRHTKTAATLFMFTSANGTANVGGFWGRSQELEVTEGTKGTPFPPYSPLPPRSEPVLQPELELPLRIGIAICRRVDPAGVGIGIPWNTDLRIRIPQVHVIQHVHEFETDFDFTRLVHGKVLEQRCIGSPIAGAPKSIPWQVAERALCRTAEGAVGVA